MPNFFLFATLFFFFGAKWQTILINISLPFIRYNFSFFSLFSSGHFCWIWFVVFVRCHSMDPSPFARTSFWAMSFGLTVNWLSSSGVGQTTVQRFLSVPDLHASRRFKSINIQHSYHFWNIIIIIWNVFIHNNSF